MEERPYRECPYFREDTEIGEITEEMLGNLTLWEAARKSGLCHHPILCGACKSFAYCQICGKKGHTHMHGYHAFDQILLPPSRRTFIRICKDCHRELHKEDRRKTKKMGKSSNCWSYTLEDAMKQIEDYREKRKKEGLSCREVIWVSTPRSRLSAGAVSSIFNNQK